MHCDLLADNLEAASEFAELFDDDWECPNTGFWSVESVSEVDPNDHAFPLLTPVHIS